MDETRAADTQALTLADKQKVLFDWNKTDVDYGDAVTVQALLQQQAEKSPEAVAVVFGDQRLSYRELNQRANQLAHALIDKGANSDTLIGLCLERSVEMVVAIVATLKAGAAYVPLDPTHPRERLAAIVQDADIRILLTQSSHSDKVDASDTLVLDRQWSQIEPYAADVPTTATTAADAAYAIYTSGSTGTPKGVLNTHAGIVNRLRWMQDTFKLDGGDVVLQKTPYSFDVSVWEFLWPLISGARLVMAKPEGHKDRVYLAQLIKEQAVTVTHFVPSMLHLFLDTPDPADSCRSLRYVMCSGEALTPELVKRYYSKLNVPLHNLYGPTEAAVDVSHWPCPNDANLTLVPIGKPIANTQLYILDEQLNPVVPGKAGELHIGGIQLARGYIKREELTRDRFIKDPFNDAPDARLYKSGDLARHLPDGNIEYLGRLDFQVKLRGFRIELGEIESVLRKQSGVKDAVVIVREDVPGDQRLVAYLLTENETPQADVLTQALGARLPEYMVPADYVVLDGFPLTSSGKTDRKALPAPERKRSSNNDYIAAQSDKEKQLAANWQQLLGIDEIGIHDNFFQMGGHSLLATRTLAMVRDTWQTLIPFEAFYNHPTIAELISLIEDGVDLPVHKQYPPLVPVSHEGDIPVSFPQESIIFLNQMASGLLAYNFQGSIHFKGELNVPLMEAAIDHMVERHESLRTTFHIKDGIPVQKIHSAWKITIPVIDLRNTPRDQLQNKCDELIHDEVRYHFDINELPLLRWTLLRLSEDEFIVVHVEHHLPHDGWSFALFLQEFRDSYSALCKGGTPSLPPMPIQFADYTLWQRKYLQGKPLHALLDYWTNTLDGASPELNLPTDFPRPAKQSYRGAEVMQELGADLSNDLRDFCRREGVTLYMAMLAAFYTLIHRYTRQQDLVIGVGVANRNLEASECLLGMIVNTIALRLDLRDDQPFRELLSKVKEITLRGFTHQDLPFEKLVEALKLERDLSRNPLFQTMFSFHDSAVPELNVPGAKGKLHYRHNGSAKFDLGVIAIPWKEQRTGLATEETRDSITVRWEYATDLFKPESIERLTQNYSLLLKQIISAPQQIVRDYQLTDEAAQQQLQAWNNTTTPFDHDLCVHSIFEKQVAATPDAIALVCDNETLSYAELNQRANQLAHYLIEQGVSAEQRVGVCMERSIDAVVSLLAIIKAGGAYLPLDASYPEERIRFMLEDSSAALALTHKNLLAAQNNCTVVDISELTTLNHYSNDNPVNSTDPERLLYIIYTSGSTGTPKGVEVPHRAVNRLVQNSGVAEFGPQHTFMLLAPISFDASTFEIWGALLNGSRCVIYSGKLPEYDMLQQLITQQGVTTLWLTASLFNTLIDEAPLTLRGIKQLLTGGEALSVDHIRRAQAALPETQFINGYGPTENTTFTCCYRIPSVLDDNLMSIPIGRPIGNTQVYVLNEEMQHLPIGVPGELYTTGAGLARGYQNQVELTAERFVDNPFNSGEKLYKTGDLVRYLPDGNIEYRGRIDQQIKLRGFRIEPGEIENVLRRHDNIANCAVDLKGDTNKQLVAYAVLSDAIETEQLLSYLKQKLPAYMVPSHIVLMDELPLSANGKIDLRALPDPAHLSESDTFSAPEGETEQGIADIWRTLLGVEHISRDDNFFAIGGHSLLATQAIARINTAFGLTMTVPCLFEHSTISQLAAEIEQQQLLLMADSDDLEAMLKDLD